MISRWSKKEADVWDARYAKRTEKVRHAENLIERVEAAVDVKRFHSRITLSSGDISISISGPRNKVAYTNRNVRSKDFADWTAEDFMAFEAFAIKELIR